VLIAPLWARETGSRVVRMVRAHNDSVSRSAPAAPALRGTPLEGARREPVIRYQPFLLPKRSAGTVL